MEEVIATDTIPITITSDGNHRQFVVRQLRSCSNWQRSSMKGMHTVGIEVSREIGGTSNTAYYKHLTWQNRKLRACFLNSVQKSKVTAARTPIRINLTLVVFW